MLHAHFLHLTVSFEGFDLSSPNVRNGQFFSRLRCQPNNRAMCALDEPTMAYSRVTKEQCCSYCNSVGWKWFNFIGDEDATKCNVGDCQLFDSKPQSTSTTKLCSLWKARAVLSELTLNRIDQLLVGSKLIHPLMWCNQFTLLKPLTSYSRHQVTPTIFMKSLRHFCPQIELLSEQFKVVLLGSRSQSALPIPRKWADVSPLLGVVVSMWNVTSRLQYVGLQQLFKHFCCDLNADFVQWRSA